MSPLFSNLLYLFGLKQFAIIIGFEVISLYVYDSTEFSNWNEFW